MRSLINITLILGLFQPTLSGFGYDEVVSLAKTLSTNPPQTKKASLPQILRRDVLTYDTYRHIRFRPSHALWHQAPTNFRTGFFHLGYLFQTPIQVYEISGQERHLIPFRKEAFDYGVLDLAESLPEDLGFAGLKFLSPLNQKDVWDELGVFQGASYFRFLGQGQRYGLSARGLAIDSAENGLAEEFPTFTKFWLQRPGPHSQSLTIYALLESDSVTGAYRFLVKPGVSTLVDVECTLFIKKPPKSTIGIAPLTSMFWFGENTSVRHDDFRPEVHDSDGLLIKTSSSEWIWRPLATQKHLTTSTFSQTNPKGFGLMQRDRRPEHYQDYANPYHHTPSLFIEPLHDWGSGEVRLCELPTDRETNDNIVAFWCPRPLPKAGDTLTFRYRQRWTHEKDLVLSPNRVMATRSGADPFKEHVRIYTVDFTGPSLKKRSPPKVKFHSVPQLTPEHIGIVPSPHDDSWRVTLKLPHSPASPPETQLFLTLTDEKDQPISETWNYLMKPPSH